MSSAFEMIWDAVYAKILELDLAGITSVNVKQQQWPLNPSSGEMTSGIFVCPVTETLRSEGSNARSEIGYGFEVCLIQASNQTLGKGTLGTLLTWREAIRRAFHDKLPITAGGVVRTWCEPGKVALPDAFAKQYDASALVIRCYVYEG
ncbi:hypothetical protein LOC68_09860 [Blastopirellula sp. JC732]|uniref:Uncharacterized protein n=1 Tax=Blastopirellula sediminis TaxID=2894196 RepID=A0A9X1MKB3_9BACT|nr:hypothetical protein [Blastopirellula sediminis]MCC9608520.1 hypothetical protein [Blastopirellula sediminis]MCC9628703.1 hypothetical protein [Blastopirellula sediminis]